MKIVIIVKFFAVAITVMLLMALTMNVASAEHPAKVKVNLSEPHKTELNLSEPYKEKVNPSEQHEIVINLSESITIPTSRSSWSIETVDSDGYGHGYTSLALDSNCYPHISYGYGLKYAKWTGSAWSIESVDSTRDAYNYTSLALDSNDYPHISYLGHNYLKYAKWTGSAWDIEIVDSTRYVGKYTSIALDTSDCPHISYFHDVHGKLLYAKWTGSAWDIEIVDSAGYVGEYTSIALDTNDCPHISYYDYINKSLKYAKWTGSAWDIETVDLDGYAGRYTSIALDTNDYPHISYLGHNYLKYAKWTGSAWSIETLDLDARRDATSIALDTNDYPHISYYCSSPTPYADLKYAKWTGSIWSLQVVDSLGDVGMGSSIALDTNDCPHISYYDNSYDALKYAYYISDIVTLLNITQAQTDKSTYALSETVTISCIVQNETGYNITADSVNVVILKPDSSIEWVTMTEGLVGHYNGTFTNTSLNGTYNVTIYANKTGYVNDTAEASFEVVSENISGDISFSSTGNQTVYLNVPKNANIKGRIGTGKFSLLDNGSTVWAYNFKEDDCLNIIVENTTVKIIKPDNSVECFNILGSQLETINNNNESTLVEGTSKIIEVPKDYPTIQDAINNASSGDTVKVAPGIYRENILMKEGITLKGSGAYVTIIDGGGNGNVIYAYGITSCTIESFTIRNSGQHGGSPGNVGIHINPRGSGNFVIRNCIIQDNGNGISVWNFRSGSIVIENNTISNNIYDGIEGGWIRSANGVISKNTITNNGRSGYHDWAGGGSRTFKNNIICSNEWYGINPHRSSPRSISYNDVWNNSKGNYYEGYSGPPTPFIPDPGTGEISANPIFVAPKSGNYHLQAGSPCIGAGENGVDMGAFSYESPVAFFTYSSQNPVVNEMVTFNASLSYDPDNIISYGWNFGDGTTATGDVVDHSYSNSGTYVINLTVTNTSEAIDTYGKVIEVYELLSLNVLRARTDKPTYNLSENVIIACSVQNEFWDNITADNVTAKIVKPDDSTEWLRLSEVTKGNYEGIFTNATTFGVYNVTIYANKSGYVNDTAKLRFTVAIHGDIDGDGIPDEIYVIDESDGDLWSPPVTDGRYIAYTTSSGYMAVFDISDGSKIHLRKASGWGRFYQVLKNGHLFYHSDEDLPYGMPLYHYDIKANTDTEVWRSDGACEVTFDGSLAAWRIHTLKQWKIHYMDVNSPSISGEFNCFWDASPVADNELIAFLNKSTLLIGDTVTGIVTDTGCKVYNMHSHWLYNNQVVYLTCEKYCGFDLDGDGVVDTDSYVPYVVLYDLLTGNNMVISETGSSGYMRLEGATPSMTDHWIAYTIWENWDKTDCNGDGDNLDEVVALYNSDNSNRAVIGSGCGYGEISNGGWGSFAGDGFVYLMDDFVVYQEWEEVASYDVNGDGDSSDNLIRIYNLKTNSSTIIFPGRCPGGDGHGIITWKASEEYDLDGVDFNNDGDSTDTLVFYVGLSSMKADHELYITQAQKDKITYTVNENVTVSCIIQNETGYNITADSVDAEILKPDSSIEWVTMAEGLVGHYNGTFTNTSLNGTYNVTIYANKTGYVNDTAELWFEVANITGGLFIDSNQDFGSGSLAVAVGDIDNDGDLDVIFGDGGNKVYRNSGDGIFSYDYTFGISGDSGAGDTKSLKLGDFDGDGDLDLIEGILGYNAHAHAPAEVIIYENGGEGNFTYVKHLIHMQPSSYWDVSQFIELGDIDNDTDLDIVICLTFSNSVEIYLNDGGDFVKSHVMSSPFPKGGALGDIDNDGDLDLVTSNSEGVGNKVFKNNGSGYFIDTGQSLGSSYTYSVALADIDNDGDLDLAAANINTQNKIYLNDGTGNFTFFYAFGTARGYSHPVVFGDIDCDNDIDMITGGDTIYIYLNNGRGQFIGSIQNLTGTGSLTGDVALEDIDDDGDLDLITAGWKNKLYINTGERTLLNITQAQTDKSTYAFTETVTISCIVQNETGHNITADSVNADILKPDRSIEWVTMTEGLVGHYNGTFTNTSLNGTYNVMIYANKTGYVNDTAELSFEVSTLPVHNLDTGENFSSIQAAIDDSDTLDGHTIRVDAGTYNENVDVNKRLTIRSENGADVTVVQAVTHGYVIEVTASFVTISGFTVTGATGACGGIWLHQVDHCNICDNKVLHNDAEGIRVTSSCNNTLSGNDCSDNSVSGITIASSNDNEFESNIVNSNHFDGIHMANSNNNVITKTTTSNNDWAIRMDDTSICSNNLIYLNNFINNGNNIFISSGSTNIWNSPLEITYTYDGTAYTNYLGNYWDDYTGSDANNDGIGDTHYTINSEDDYYPLMVGFENYTVKPPTPSFTSHAPESPVDDYVGAARTFSITIDQTVDVSWQINGTEVQTNASVTEASYTNTSAVNGTWNVSAIVSNANGTDMQTWDWTVTSPCFIATAAYGTPLHGDIDVLRGFRDDYLMPNPTGRAFVKLYYDVSPPLANAIRDNEGLRTAVRAGFVKPVVYITRRFIG